MFPYIQFSSVVSLSIFTSIITYKSYLLKSKIQEDYKLYRKEWCKFLFPESCTESQSNKLLSDMLVLCAEIIDKLEKVTPLLEQCESQEDKISERCAKIENLYTYLNHRSEICLINDEINNLDQAVSDKFYFGLTITSVASAVSMLMLFE